MFDRDRLLAILRFPDGGDLAGTLDALAAGGVTLAEITIDTPGALRAVREAVAAGHTVGVGTVTSPEHVRQAAAAGATFVVSPGLVPEVVRTAVELGVAAIPGVYTATEVLSAAASGAAAMKLFPASLGGPKYLSTLRGPFPALDFVPTGGVRLDDIGAYLAAGASAVAIGSELVGRSAPTADSELEAIRRRAERAVALTASTDPVGLS